MSTSTLECLLVPVRRYFERQDSITGEAAWRKILAEKRQTKKAPASGGTDQGS